jgi:hypothetical protein
VSDTSLVFNAVGRDRGVSSLLAKTATGVRQANLAGAASTVALGAAWAGAAAYGTVLAFSASRAAGAVALLPAALAGATLTIVAAKATTFGLADAWKATGQEATAGGGKSVSTAKAVAAAQREVRTATQALADAQRTALEAQLAVTRARQDEAERLADLNRSITNAALDEEAAVRGVTKAQRDLLAAQRSGNADDIIDADLAYRQAEATLADVRARVEDLAAEQADGAKKGVEGSDAVQAALQRQQDAQRQVTDAAQRLADAQDAVREASAKAASAGIDPATAALAKLSPNGRAVILTLRDLATGWAGAARAGQQATFSRVSGDLRQLSGIYLPLATSWLGRMGGSFNTAIRESLGLAKTNAFARDTDTILGSTATTTDRLARAVRPVVNGILQFVAVGAAFLPGLAGNVGDIADRFERWATASRQSGEMQGWIGNGVAMLKDFAAIAWNVVMSVVAVFHAGGDGGSTVDSLVRGSAAMRAWLESAQGQDKIKEVMTNLRDILSGLGQVIPVVTSHGGEFNDTLNVTGTVVSFAAGHLDTLAKLLPVMAAGFVAAKAAEAAGNVARVASLPLLAAQVAANRGLRGALAEHTVALQANTAATATGTGTKEASTVATVAGDAATKRSVFSLAAQKVAMAASAVWLGIVTAAQWAWNLALSMNPIGLIIIGIIALIAVIVLIATKTTWFQTAWNWAWGGIKAAAAAVGDWFVNTLWKKWIVGAWDGMVNKGVEFYNWIHGLPGKIKSALVNVASILSAPFRSAFNSIASFWNRTAGQLHFTAPSWIPGLGGKGFSMPQLPMLARGGRLTAGGSVIVGDDGGPEVVDLPTGATVTPLSRAGGNPTQIVFTSDGSRIGNLLLEIMRESIRTKGQGGNVQLILGPS